MTISHDEEDLEFNMLRGKLRDFGKLECVKIHKKNRYMLLLYNNSFLKDDKLIEIAKDYNIVLQPDLFSEF